ncbi:hypothetical protein vBAbaMPhT2_235 [Acinetobacter phage vB_AbaM_PhT2]|uniref:Uncharacterized protein n=2 Tax=Hadassahvirus TaxID=2842716 RepID=A0A6B9SZ11_9CAUD|nr:hypothetical protein HYP74_gp210 [Acinetobacter phage AbTZA1]YP_009887246.1 hypothetical protein HYQ24_gp203 [Acinetobacter phage vB_AbaM_PhT2]QQM13840.1 hypothetical protein CPT_Maestro_106 [Acinetobacter phage Maestro]QQM18596.1 hypothetical protein CPT_Morttis_103 [Acinetobacter phage Morttis]QQO96303.1 hypothetical protein CPT_Minot_100 [Acinetobacter phage Minot]QQO96551.1 hypothetical protein CPT_Mokit_100 [Acinetobacter phage Mokit]QQO96806.1 hypothetical protein CPT_Melin_105 [Acin
MNLKQYLANLNKLVEKHPELLKCKVVTASDDEGNCVRESHFHASICTWDPIEQMFDETGEKVICLN